MDAKQELLNYYPHPEEAKKILAELDLSDAEIEQKIQCHIHPLIIYETAHRIIDQYKNLSDNVLEQFAKVMNIKDNRLSFKTEFLLKAVYFLKKKSYAQYMIEREGKLIQEMTQTNIGVKSDIPELTRKMMNHLFKVIFYTNVDEKLIMKAIQMWKNKFNEIIKERSVQIATPCGFNKPLKEYKVMPDGIRGMILYNMIVKQEAFKYGNKGFKIYIKGIDYKKLGYDNGKKFLTEIVEPFISKYNLKPKKKNDPFSVLNRIVIPTSFETIPDWIILDTKTILSKIFYDKANEILEPLGIVVSDNISNQVMLNIF